MCEYYGVLIPATCTVVPQDKASYRMPYDIHRYSQLKMTDAAHVPVSKSTSTGKFKVNVQSIDIDSRPPAPLPPEVSIIA